MADHHHRHSSADAGRAARKRRPLLQHGAWKPAPNRADPITLLEDQDRLRVFDLVPIRYGRMATSPLAFFRGAAAIMSHDLARTPRSGFTAQLCGDAHVGNFGGFAPADGSIVFDINDFDETLPGPWEWDVKRLVASLEVAARDRAMSSVERQNVVRAAAEAYRSAMHDFAASGFLDVWYRQLDTTLIGRLSREVVRQPRRDQVDASADRAKDNERSFERQAHRVDGDVRFVDVPPLVESLRSMMPAGEARLVGSSIEENLSRYREKLPDDSRRVLDHFELRDLARKVIGVGGVGMRAYLVLLTGRDHDETLVLQFKEASRSALEPYAGKSRYRQGGRRIVEGQRLIQASSDILLGWAQGPDVNGVVRDYYVRQLWDWRIGPDLEHVGPAALLVLAQACAWTLAHVHARTGDRVAIAHYLGRDQAFVDAFAEFAMAYADQNQRDYETLLSAVERRRVVARTGV